MIGMRAAGAALLAALLFGCAGRRAVSGPEASAPMPNNVATWETVAASVRASHPGSEVGMIDAVQPGSPGWVSVGRLPVDRVPEGSVVTILDDRQAALLSGVVRGKNPATDAPHLQVEYQPPANPTRDPRPGDLVIWFPGSAVVAMPGETPPAASPPPSTEPSPQNLLPKLPATQPAEPTPQPPAPPATQPAASAPSSAAPATQPDFNK